MRILLALLLCTAATAADLRVYFIGNSVTDTVNYEGFDQLCAAGGVEVTWARHMIPGAPLDWLWNNQDSGFSDEPFGRSRQAVTDFPWDAITLQPFDRHLPEDLAVITEIIDLQRAQNPEAHFYIYQRWPRMVTTDGTDLQFDKDAYDPAEGRLSIDLTRIKSWQELNQRSYTGGWDGSNESADYTDQLLAAAREAKPEASVLLVPVGAVMSALDEQMAAGAVPGYSTVWELYKDGIHLGPTGSYLVGLVFATTLADVDPRELGAEHYGAVDAELVPLIQQLTFDIVNSTPEARPTVAP